MEKNNNNAVIVLLVVIIILMGVGLGYFIGKGFNNNSTTGDNNSNNSSNNSQNNNQNSISYVGNYGVKVTDGVESGISQLYLREDGTFKYAMINFMSYTPYVGTYKVDGNKIILEEKVSYGSDACFFKNSSSLKTIVADIKDQNTITITDEGRTLDFVKGIAEEEDDHSKSWYVINPVDGVTPTGAVEAWENCDSIVNGNEEVINYNSDIPAGKTLIKTIEKDLILNGQTHKLLFTYYQEKKFGWYYDEENINYYEIGASILLDGKLVKKIDVYELYKATESMPNITVNDNDIKVIKDTNNNKQYIVYLYRVDDTNYMTIVNDLGIVLYEDSSARYAKYVSTGNYIPKIEVNGNFVYVLNNCGKYRKKINISNGSANLDFIYFTEQVELEGGTC